MNKAHQKELQKNDLETGLEKVASTVRPYYAPLAILAAVAMVAAIGYMLYERSVRNTNTAAWSKWSVAVFDRDPDSEVLRKVGEELGDTPASHWALQLAADEDLREGSYLLYENRELATQKLESALDLYEQVIKGSADDLMLLTRARFGAGRTSECLFKVDAAVDFYQQIASSEASSSALGKAAKERIGALKKPETKDWYKWFATQEPYKQLPNRNSTGSGSTLGLPDVPGSFISGLRDAPKTPSADKPAPNEGDKEKAPGLDLSKPAGEREETPSRFEDKPPTTPPADPPPAGDAPK